MKKIAIFLIGIIAGLSLNFFLKNDSSETNSYIKLKDDFCIEGAGFLKEGTLLKFDQAYSEGFSRYVLYLNFPSSYSGERYETERENEVIPYWLKLRDSTCVSVRD